LEIGSKLETNGIIMENRVKRTPYQDDIVKAIQIFEKREL